MNIEKEYFKGFDTDIKIPSIDEDGNIKYTIVSKELANEAVNKGYMSSNETN